MISHRPQVGSDGYAHAVERMTFRADAREGFSASRHIAGDVQGSLVFFQNLLALGRTLLEERPC